jgi:hypothetical protein
MEYPCSYVKPLLVDSYALAGSGGGTGDSDAPARAHPRASPTTAGEEVNDIASGERDAGVGDVEH